MARQTSRLRAEAMVTLTKNGRHADGGGLYLSISPNGGRRWVCLFRWHGRPTEIGFGSARDVSLARESWPRRPVASSPKGSIQRTPERRPRQASEGPRTTPEGSRKVHVRGLRRPVDRDPNLFRNYANALGRLPVDKITTDDVLTVLKPLWNGKPETAYLLRVRIERVLDAAKAQGLRTGENPARWRGPKAGGRGSYNNAVAAEDRCSPGSDRLVLVGNCASDQAVCAL